MRFNCWDRIVSLLSTSGSPSTSQFSTMSFVPKVFRFYVTVVSMLLEPALFFHQSFVMWTLMMCFCFYFCIIISQSMFEMLPRLMGRNESLLQSCFKTHFHLLANHKTMKIWWFPCFLLVAVYSLKLLICCPSNSTIFLK
jgi:hypothetical protein